MTGEVLRDALALHGVRLPLAVDDAGMIVYDAGGREIARMQLPHGGDERTCSGCLAARLIVDAVNTAADEASP